MKYEINVRRRCALQHNFIDEIFHLTYKEVVIVCRLWAVNVKFVREQAVTKKYFDLKCFSIARESVVTNQFYKGIEKYTVSGC